MLTEQQSLMLILVQQQLKYMLPSNVVHSLQPYFEQAEQLVFRTSGKPEGEWLNKVLSMPSSLPLLPAQINDDILQP